jgi:hypothetical protein
MPSMTAIIVMWLATWGTSAAQQTPSAGYPAPGHLISIGVRSLHLHCVLVLSSDSSASERARLHRLDRSFCDQTDAGDGLELLSSNSLYVIANGSGHEIHLYKPDFVVQAVERMVAAKRDRVPLSRAH